MERQNLNRKKATRIKIVSMGDAEVGKSCIIKRYCEKRFVNKYLATIGIDYGVTKVHVEEKEVKVNIFDMAGHPIFYEVRNEFYKDTQGVLLVFDVTCQQSFDSLQLWLNEMRKEIGDPTDMDKVVFVVCANKSDKKRVVDESESRIWANNCGFHYFETSAQTGDGVNKMFQTLFEEVINAIENGGKPTRVSTTVGYSKEQSEAIHKLVCGKDNYERLGLHYGASRDDVNRAYKKLAMLIHPDKSVAPGTEEAFKVLVDARTALLKKLPQSMDTQEFARKNLRSDSTVKVWELSKKKSQTGLFKVPRKLSSYFTVESLCNISACPWVDLISCE